MSKARVMLLLMSGMKERNAKVHLHSKMEMIETAQGAV